MTQVNGFKGFVGYSLRELDLNETNLYCFNLKTSPAPPSTQNRINFTGDFMLRSYTSGCYYYDIDTGKWYSNGIDVYEDTNLEKTHCVSNHLTSFAGGLVLTPSTINFKYLYSNLVNTQNPTIYITVILFICLYIFFACWSRIMDRRDETKTGVYLLKDNHKNDSYFYELIVFTGNRSESETNSKVENYKIIFFLLA